MHSGSARLPYYCEIRDIAFQNEFAFAADRYDCLRIIDASDPEDPYLATTFPEPGSVANIASDGRFAYYTDQLPNRFPGPYPPGRLRIVDFNLPHEPYETFVSAPLGRLLARRGSYLYITVKDSGVAVWNVSNPRQPELTSPPSGGYWALGATIVNGKLYEVAGGIQLPFFRRSPGLAIYDVSRPHRRVTEGFIAVRGVPDRNTVGGVAVANGIAYIVHIADSLRIVNVTDSRHPALAGGRDLDGQDGVDVALASGALFAASSRTIFAFDLGDPLEPVEIARWDLDSPVTSLDGVGDQLWATTLRGGVTAYDVSDPAQPVTVGKSSAFTGAYETAIAGTRLFVAEAGRIGVYDAEEALDVKTPPTLPPTAPELLSVSPNPFNATVEIAFRSIGKGGYRLKILDGIGREVAVFEADLPDLGNHSLRWEAPAAGVYFVRLECPAGVRSLKAVCIR